MSESTVSESLRRWLAPPLMVFVLISIGFALGRQTAPVQPTAAERPAAAEQARVVVTYLHGTIRCVSCNSIERLLRATLSERYAAAMQDGRLVFREVNFDTDEALAKRYDVASSTAVISWERDGEEQGFVKLDGVWERKDDSEVFAAYIAEHIDAHLPPPSATGAAP
ncbi:MAG: nitrophenyl compound nitroreductase subunit ArsF family protein [Planctomycetota bacterium]|jgi:hypothetical protein|nr:nitrophenyl compound nitroreductase subunit ArsF family protein [Planctomycetota bacterium]